jgi:hypothetical protein
MLPNQQKNEFKKIVNLLFCSFNDLSGVSSMKTTYVQNIYLGSINNVLQNFKECVLHDAEMIRLI